MFSKRWIQIAALLFTLQMSAKAPPSPPPPPYDADLFLKDEQVFSGHVEFLYWTIEEGATEYAMKMSSPAWGSALTTQNYAQGNFEMAGYGFDPGLRVALSFYRAPRYWEIKWQYTRATIRGRDHAGAPDEANEFLTGTWPQIITAPLQGAKSYLHFNYNVLDMVVARVFNPNPHLRIRFIGGATSAWMSQQWVIRYFNAAQNNTRINNRWTYAAGGLKLGSTVDWFWEHDLYITATGAAGLFMGSYHNQSKQTADVAPAGAAPGSYNPDLPLRNAKMSNIRPSFMAQMSLGPSYQKNFCNARLALFAGYEIALWTNWQEIYRSTAGAPNDAKEPWTNTSTLALHGVTVRVSGDF